MCVCFCEREKKTPLIRCHVVLKAVTCRGSSAYLSVTASLLRVCGWLGSTLPNTHICCRSDGRGQDVEMTLIVKHNARQRRRLRRPLPPPPRAPLDQISILGNYRRKTKQTNTEKEPSERESCSGRGRSDGYQRARDILFPAMWRN